MKTLRKCIFILTLCLVLLTSCGTGETPAEPDPTNLAKIDTSNPTEFPANVNDSSFYYTESVFLQMSSGEGYYTSLANIDENDVLSFRKILTPTSDESYYYLTISNGNVTDNISVLAGYSKEDDFNYSNSMAFDEETGRYYALNNENQSIFTINTYDNNLNLINEGVPYEWGSDNMSSRELHYFDGKLYFLSTYDKLYVNNIDGTSVDLPSELSKSDELPKILSIDIDQQGNLYFLGETPSASTLYCIGKYDLVKDELVYQKKISNKIFGSVYLHYNEADNCLYVADDQGIHRFDSEIDKIEQIVVFGEDTSFITGLNPYLNGFISDNDGNFYLAIDGFDQGGNYIYKLTKTYGKKPEVIRKEIVLTASYKQDFMVEAIARYNATSEDYKVVFDTFYENREEYMANNETGRTKFLTKIMTNDVGDIIATGGMGLDVYNVFQTDAFVDLREYVENDPSYNDLSLPILNAITIDNRIYGLPIGHITTRMVYNKELGDKLGFDTDPGTAKWSDILQYARQVNGIGIKTYIFQGYTVEVLEAMLNANLPDLINIQNKTVDLKQHWFLDLIQDFKEVSGLDYFSSESNENISSINPWIGKNCLFGYSWSDIPYNDIRDYLKSPFEIQFLPVFSGEQNHNGIAYAFIMYSISNSSENKEAAWDFLSFLLEEDIETLNSMQSTAMNTKAVEKIYGEYENIEELKEQYTEITNEIDTLYDMGAGLKYDVFAPIWKYINDELTLEEAIEEAEYNVWLRLNE